ncbi:MAG: pilus assembly protein PilM [Deltaproteobacteria bacterium]|nr:pilus assembly protein PilM [Deltaproteobacteria bacterium]
MIFQSNLGVAIEHEIAAIVHLKSSLRGRRIAESTLQALNREASVDEKIDQTAAAVKEFIAERRLSGVQIFVSLPRDMAILRYVEFPKAVRENLRETLGYEMDKYMPLPVESIYYDFQVVEEQKEEGLIRVLLIAVKKSIIDRIHERFKGLGIGIAGVELRSTAAANYFTVAGNSGGSSLLALLYVGAEGAEFTIIDHGLLRHSRVSSRGQSIPAFLAGEFDNLQTGEDPAPLQKLQIYGDITEDPATLLPPGRENVTILPLDLAATGLPSAVFIAAYGLALKGFRSFPSGINLLPPAMRKGASRAAYYTLFVLVGLLVAGIISWGAGAVLSKHFYLQRLEQERGRLQADVKNVERIQKASAELEAQISFLARVREDKAPILSILEELTERIPETAWIRRLSFSGESLEVEGYAASASDLISLLEESPLFKEVAFASPITKNRDGKETFRIGMKIQ